MGENENLPRGKTNLFIVISVAMILQFVVLLYSQYGRVKPSIKIGVLHSLPGTMWADLMTGHYTAWNYFQSLDIRVKLRVDTARSGGTTNFALVNTILAQQECT